MILGVGSLGSAQVALVEDGEARAVVVVPSEASEVEQYAAEELVYHVEKGTGVTLQIVPEDALPEQPAGRVRIGGTRAAGAAGIDATALPLETVVLRTTAEGLLIVGEDTEGDPLSEATRCGTLWGVYELLDRFMGVRWLWPGELGVHVPATDTVVIPAIDETIPPTMIRRRVRDGLRRPAGDTGLTEEGFETYAQAQRIFLRRHRMGRSLPLRYGHAFERYWEQYGEEHPDWFQLLPNGQRGPATPTSRTSMCVSTPEFHEEIIERWKQQRAENPGEWINVNGCENDISGLCVCEDCIAWDGPQPDLEDIYPLGERRMVSDRYARFWLTLQQMAAEEDPDAMVIGYAYTNYYPKPTSGIELNANILIGMCPWPGWWYPRNERKQEWLKEQWAGWAETGASIFLRPNYTLDSYTMPHIYARQFADEFQHYAANAMVATDFDSLTGQWAAQGTNLYLLFRLHTRADRPVDEVLDEYYSAFGPAAEQVERYFDYWEEYTMSDTERFDRAQREAGVSRYRNFAAFAHVLYPQELFEPAEAILAEAAEAAAGDEVAAARVDYLRKGLQHARMCARLAAINAGAGADISPVAARRLMDEIIAFRRATEGEFIANYDRCAMVEERSWALMQIEGYEGEPLRAVAEEVAPLPGEVEAAGDLPVFSLRHGGMFVALLEADEPFRALINPRAVGRADGPVAWQLYGPDEQSVAKGEAPVGEITEIEATSGQAGVHVLVVNPGSTCGRVTLLNDHAALASSRQRMVYQSSPMFFFVPEGTAEFTFELQSPGPGETARVLILDPEGNEVDRIETGEEREVIAEVEVPAGMSGRAWQIQIERGEMGTLEDYTIILDERLPAFLSHAPDRLVIPE
jgi:hypothetical protein